MTEQERWEHLEKNPELPGARALLEQRECFLEVKESAARQSRRPTDG